MDDDALARARRAFIRDHHPDRGGDIDRFVEGLRRFDELTAGRGPAPVGPRPTVRRSNRLDRLVLRLARDVRRRLAGRPPRHLQ